MSENLKPFDQLSAADKVRAILAVIRRPLNKESVYGYAGIQTELVSVSELQAVEAIFNSDEVVITHEEEELRYILSQAYISTLSTQIDLKTASGAVAQAILAKVKKKV
ncbi:MAG TPA: hypothetical protein VD999_00575 [Vitreimonas sp.]|nr:hypothetical protein [Vitreimonas sp.]